MEPTGPVRLQIARPRRRWRAEHRDAVIVAKGSPWANPFQVREWGRRRLIGPFDLAWLGRDARGGTRPPLQFAPEDALHSFLLTASPAEVVDMFRLTLLVPPPPMRAALRSRAGRFTPFSAADVRAELAGRDLACWCPLPVPGEPDLCHASVLLEVANGTVGFEAALAARRRLDKIEALRAIMDRAR